MFMPSLQDPLDFGYKYPFSSEARGIVESLDSKKIDEKYLNAGILRVQEALKNGRIEFSQAKSNETKLTYLVSYVYARMLISAVVGNSGDTYFLQKYAIAEARRVGEALQEEKEPILKQACDELKIDANIRDDGSFSVPFYDYVRFAPSMRDYALIHQDLKDGFVYLQRSKLIRVLEEATKRRIVNGLPVDYIQLPKEVVNGAKRISLPKRQINVATSGRSSDWIEKLLDTPIPDFRHRSVNLILAPYLVNIKKMGVEEAVKTIMAYIERCKQINPNTNITEQYVKYQCNYAKKKGLRPYSIIRAKALIGNIFDFSNVDNKVK